MTTPEIKSTNPWESIQALIRNEESGELQGLLDDLSPREIARALTRLDEEERHRLLLLLEPDDAADLIEELADAQGADLIEELTADEAARIVEEMESHHRADLLAELDAEDLEAILGQMSPEDALAARRLLEYGEDTAGGIMATEFVAYDQDFRVDAVLKDMRENAERYADYGVHYAYVTSGQGTLVGAIRLRDLLLSPADAQLRDIMIVNPVYLLVDTPIQEVIEIFDRYNFWVTPVTDGAGRMIGVVRRADAEEALGEEQERTFMRFSGIITGEELRDMPLRERASKRLVWLMINLPLSMLAASVILFNEETIENIFALVFFMPIICNLSGCSGNQAVAVSIRELTLGVIQPKDYFRVWVHELSVGVFNGIALGIALALSAVALSIGDPIIGVAVGCAFALNTMVAVSLGGCVPLLLRGLNVDPAMAAPPIITTLTDMCGFLLLLGIARFVLSMGWITL